MVDVSKIQPGDKITLGGEFEVTHVDFADAYRSVRINIQPGLGFWLDPALITAHHPKPKPLGVGDRVKDDARNTWEIVADRHDAEGNTVFALWSQTWGFAGFSKRVIESWERVS